MKDFTGGSPIARAEEPNCADLKILLWDIDGTLMRSIVRGGYTKYFSATMRKVFGSAGKLDEIVPSGMTDTQIMYEALKNEGWTADRIFAEKEQILKVFETEMKSVLAEKGEPYEVLPGAREILAATAEDAMFVNGLLTGNLSVAAKIKLETVGLWKYFEESPGAFGEISHERKNLAIAAGKLFREKYDFDFSPDQFIVIGDTPNDVACARHFGAKCLAVGTGRGQNISALLECEPDRFIEDLSNTDEVLGILKTV